ncbi:MAG: hypothetical protein AB7F39_06585 [Variibacter sp.]
MKLQLVQDWKNALRWHSVRAAIATAGLWGAVFGLNEIWPAFAGTIPLRWLAIGGMVLGALTGIGRVTKQPGLPE